MKTRDTTDQTVNHRFPHVRRMFVVALLAGAIALPACTIATSADEATPQSAPAFPTPSDDPAPLGGKGGSIVSVVDRVLPAVVNVVAETDQGQGEGTGFVIRSDGVIVTNWHVVETAQRLTVLTSDEKPERFSARVIGGDPEADLAVLDIGATNLETVAMGDSNKLQLGQQVVALGYALGLEGGPSVTTGIVSSLNRIVTAQDANCQECDQQRTYNDIIQTDAAINPGNSGGPLVNLNGEVVGINTAGAGAASAENIGFAIQIDAAKPTILGAVADPDQPVAYLGVGSINADNPQAQFEFDPTVDQGALLASIAPGGPAEKAGLKIGDVVVGFDGEAVDGAERLGELIRDLAPGDRVDIDVVDSDGDRKTIEATLGTNPVVAP